MIINTLKFDELKFFTNAQSGSQLQSVDLVNSNRLGF